MTNSEILACIDGSAFAESVCDHAAWVARRVACEVVLMHVIDYRHASGPQDLSGSIGLGSQEALLAALAALDHQAGKLALDRGRHLLDAARARVTAAGTTAVSVRQVHGPLVDRLVEQESTVRVVVIGRRGEGANVAEAHLGSNLERVVRAMHRPILMVPATFIEPTSVMLAFDNGESTRKAVEVLMRGPLFKGLACHVVTVGEPGGPAQAAHDWARAELGSAGFEVAGGVYPGDVEPVLSSYQRDHAIGMVVMGAYGHSRIRHLLVGSTTTEMMRRTPVPLLLLR